MPTQITLSDDEDIGPTLHILRPRVVEVRIDSELDAMWISVDGVERFRVDNLSHGGFSLTVKEVSKK